jgi:hypothetical protein
MNDGLSGSIRGLPCFDCRHRMLLPAPQNRPALFYTARRQVSNLRHVRPALYDHGTVHRNAFLVVILICLVALIVAYPAIESVDRWDAPGPTSDSELQYIGVLTVVGAIALFTQLLVVVAQTLFAHVHPDLHPHPPGDKPVFSFVSQLTASPPLPLRI